MCLKIEKTFKTRQEARDFKPLIAKKNIVVYKVLDEWSNGEYRSPFMDFKYEKGYHYGVKMSKDIYKWNGWRIDINKGLHAYTNINKADNSWNFTCYNKQIVKMYVPKGSSYFINKEENEIVSDNLIWY